MQHSVQMYTRVRDRISIHAPYKGCNAEFVCYLIMITGFQSMHPIKDATYFFFSNSQS